MAGEDLESLNPRNPNTRNIYLIMSLWMEMVEVLGVLGSSLWGFIWIGYAVAGVAAAADLLWLNPIWDAFSEKSAERYQTLFGVSKVGIAVGLLGITFAASPYPYGAIIGSVGIVIMAASGLLTLWAGFKSGVWRADKTETAPRGSGTSYTHLGNTLPSQPEPQVQPQRAPINWAGIKHEGQTLEQALRQLQDLGVTICYSGYAHSECIHIKLGEGGTGFSEYLKEIATCFPKLFTPSQNSARNEIVLLTTYNMKKEAGMANDFLDDICDHLDISDISDETGSSPVSIAQSSPASAVATFGVVAGGQKKSDVKAGGGASESTSGPSVPTLRSSDDEEDVG